MTQAEAARINAKIRAKKGEDDDEEEVPVSNPFARLTRSFTRTVTDARTTMRRSITGGDKRGSLVRSMSRMFTRRSGRATENRPSKTDEEYNREHQEQLDALDAANEKWRDSNVGAAPAAAEGAGGSKGVKFGEADMSA